MDLILWRHAEAFDGEEGGDDLARRLTPRGKKEASRVAAWLDRMLPEGTRILYSPAVRCEQTVRPLGRKPQMRAELAPGASVAALLEVARWPQASHPVLLVGHQPVLGRVVAQLLGITEGDCAIRKGAAWWLRSRERGGQVQAIVVAVQAPDLA